MKLSHLREGNISITDMDDRARRVIKATILSFCQGEWQLIKSRYPDIDHQDGENRQKMFYQWYETDFKTRQQKNIFASAIAWEISKKLTNLVNEYVEEHNSKLPPRLRKIEKKIRVQLEVKESSHDSHSKRAGGYYQDFESLIKIFISENDMIEAGMGALQTWAFGEGEGVEEMVDAILPVFIHEFTHFEQWRRGLSGRRTRGYVSAGGDKKGSPFYGDQFSHDGTPEQSMRYTGAAHEIEAFASGAAVQLTQMMSRGRYEAGVLHDGDEIDRLCQDIALCYADSQQMQRFLWLREYREHYIKQGIKGHELEVVFRRFMKILYKKLQQYRKVRIGAAKSIDPSRFPADWIRYTRYGLSSTIRYIASDISELIMDGKNPHERISLAGSFINRYFYKDEWDYTRELKIEKIITRLAQDEADTFERRLNVA